MPAPLVFADRQVPRKVQPPVNPVSDLLVQPNNSGTNSDDASLHRKDAWWSGFGRHGIADDLEVVLLVPAFLRPARDWQMCTHALDRDTITTQREDLRRPDLQLLRMLDAAGDHLAEQGLKADSKILIQGYSASGMFSNRFAILHPGRVKGVAAGSPGGWPIAPVTEYASQALNYPVGAADLEMLTGAVFDVAALQRVPQLFVMGDQDDNDSLDFGDGWDENAARQVDELFGKTPIERWEHARRVYEQAGMNATFLLVPGIGHDRRALQSHSTEFFRALLERERAGR